MSKTTQSRLIARTAMRFQFDRQTIYSFRLSSHFLEPNQDKRQKKKRRKKKEKKGHKSAPQRSSGHLWTTIAVRADLPSGLDVSLHQIIWAEGWWTTHRGSHLLPPRQLPVQLMGMCLYCVMQWFNGLSFLFLCRGEFGARSDDSLH